MFVPIRPMGKPRMTQRDRWAQRPAVMRYRDFCDDLRMKYANALPEVLMMEFHIGMPDSWSKKKKAAHVGQPHRQKPDIDNLSKAVMDALAKEDSYIYVLHAEKYWAEEPGIEFLSPTSEASVY